MNYFTAHVADDRWERPKLDGVEFDKLSVADNELLVTPFSLLEMEAVVKDSDGGKSSGSDGFNFAFIKRILVLDKK